MIAIGSDHGGFKLSIIRFADKLIELRIDLLIDYVKASYQYFAPYFFCVMDIVVRRHKGYTQL